MLLGGLTPCSLIDFPGRIAAVIFTGGCNFRCPYCHNPGLVDPRRMRREASVGSRRDARDAAGGDAPASAACGKAAWEDPEYLWRFLQKRRRQIDGVVVTGGEPTLQQDLLPALERMRSLGYAVKLDTNGSRPEVLRGVIERKLADYIAMDLKAPWSDTTEAAGLPWPAEALQRSVEMIIRSGIDHEFRTTALKPLHTRESLIATGRQAKGARRYILQSFRHNSEVLNPEYCANAWPFEREELESARDALLAEGIVCKIR